MIFLSAGHYPERPGACYQSFCEHSEAAQWVHLISEVIGDDVVVVPTGVLRQKTDFINNYNTSKNSFCVEIHFNSAKVDGKHVGEGAETLYEPDSGESKIIAQVIQESMISVTGVRDRGVKEGWYRMDRTKGVDFFLAKTKYPAVIVEPEFIQFESRIKELRTILCSKISESLMDIHRALNDVRIT